MKAVYVLLIALLPAGLSLHAQERDTTYWKKGGVGALGFTNTGFSEYWQAGGINSQSIVGRVNMFANYTKDKQSWQNDLALAYGVVRQGGGEARFIKNEDRIELNSKYGRKFTDKLLLSALVNFRTQFAEGFKFDPKAATILPQDTISAFMAPGYLNFGVGIDWQPSADFSVYYSPVNSKMTFVRVAEYQALYNPENDAFRYELGSNLNVKYRREIAKNILFQTQANFFSNYLQDFGAIDVNWETLTTAKVNDWFAVNFATNLIYDKDIQFDIRDENGNVTGQEPRVQFQHVLTIGLTYTFLKK